MKLQKRDHQELQLKARSTGLIAIVTDPERSRELERKLTIQKIVDDSLPISELQRTVGNRDVAQALDIQLTRLVGSLNLKWNLSDSQIKTIVEDLLDKYKNECIEDFILVFKKARQGEFGELYRLDSPVIFGWMDKYLDEKYLAIENKLMCEKESPYDVVAKPVKNQSLKIEWALPDDFRLCNTPVIKKEERDRLWMKDWQYSIGSNKRSVPPLTTKDIIEEGQVTPKKKGLTSGYKYFDVRGVQIYAVTQEHAEELAEKLVRQGILEEVKK